MAHLALVKRTCRLVSSASQENPKIELDGYNLVVADLILACRKSAKLGLKPDAAIEERMLKSIKVLEQHIARGEVIYGVNTGFGGNADTRTQNLEKLQYACVQHQQSGIITDTSAHTGYSRESESLPRDVAKALVLIRCNSLLRGHSAIRLEIIDLLLDALNQDIVPLIPKRGSVSASGDLSSLSYVAGFLEGNPDIYVSKREIDGSISIMSAAKAMKLLNRPVIRLQAKEGLAILNGTAASTALAALVLHDSHNLAVLTQIITAIATEALHGTKSNFDQFISDVRPHAGQDEVAANIRRFLDGSKLCREDRHNATGLAQDGYALRTSPQWIGPQVEDLMSANRQVEVELNSTTDNPLIDVPANRFHHGGNFQAVSITSAMEKTRTALVMLGRLLLAQCNDVVNPAHNRGLPPNLCFDDPSASFTMKGVDINIAAYFSELAFLANSVASHVQTTDLGNQPVNSLALVSARYTAHAVEILSMMCAVALYEFCQAVDIRALYLDFFQLAKDHLQSEFEEIFRDDAYQNHLPKDFSEHLWLTIRDAWGNTTKLDLVPRCKAVASKSASYILDSFDDIEDVPSSVLASLKDWKAKCTNILLTSYNEAKAEFLEAHTTESYLSRTTKAVYDLIRHELGVPLHLGIEVHPAFQNEDFIALAAERKPVVENGDIHHSTNGVVKHAVHKDMNDPIDINVNHSVDGDMKYSANGNGSHSANGEAKALMNGNSDGYNKHDSHSTLANGHTNGHAAEAHMTTTNGKPNGIQTNGGSVHLNGYAKPVNNHNQPTVVNGVAGRGSNKTIGSQVGIIFQAISSGRLMESLHSVL